MLNPADLLGHGDTTVERIDGGWEYLREVVEPTGVFVDREVQTDAQLLAAGPRACLPSAVLEDMARSLGLEPLDAGWYRERLLLERIAAKDLAGVRQLLDGGADPLSAWGTAPLTFAVAAGAWLVAAELLARGAVLVAPPGTVWSAADFAVSALDDSDEALVLLDALLAGRALDPLDGLPRAASSPRVARRLLEAGAAPEAAGPAGASMLSPGLVKATPLAVSVVRGQYDVAAALLEGGAGLEGRDPLGRTALLVAVLWGHDAPVRWLLDRGARAGGAPDAEGRTPLSAARKRPDDPGSRVLLAARRERD